MLNKTATHIAHDWVTWLLAGIGITLQPHVYFGGLVLAVAGASLARGLSPEQDSRELWVVILTALFLATLVAEIPAEWRPLELPAQPVMAITGFFSRHIARVMLRAGGLVESRSDMLIDRIIDRVLPPKRGGGGDA